jgi:hypothetical protein
MKQPPRRKHRKIIEGIDYTEAIRNLGVEYRRLDIAIEGMIGVLATRPEIFPKVPGTEMHCLSINRFQGVPALNIWFVFDDETVKLIAAELADMAY